MPAKNLGIKLLQYFAIGGLWSIGYLAYPMLVEQGFNEPATYLRQLMLLLAMPAMAFVTVVRLYSVNWRFWDPLSQIGLALVAFAAMASWGILSDNSSLASFFYGLACLAGIAWVAWLPQASTN